VTRARQVLQALPVHPDRGERKEPGVEEDGKEKRETKEIEVYRDPRERAASKALWDLRD